MTRQKVLILPKLHSYNGSETKQWFVYYSYRDPLTGKMKRFRVYDGFSEHHTVSDKKAHGLRLLKNLRRRLLNGWTPFEDRSEVIYSDDLIYRSVANKYGRMRSDVKTFNYYIIEYLKTSQG